MEVPFLSNRIINVEYFLNLNSFNQNQYSFLKTKAFIFIFLLYCISKYMSIENFRLYKIIIKKFVGSTFLTHERSADEKVDICVNFFRCE